MAVQRAAVIGHPIGHTMSPFIHERLFRLQGIQADYSVLDIADLPTAIGKLRKLDVFNITIPHKNAILPFLDWAEEKAKAFGSVNTVQNRDGRLCGFTTDGAGCRLALEKAGRALSGRLLLLGNGGAARALAFEAVSGRELSALTIACRDASREKAEALLKEVMRYGKAAGTAFCVKSYEELEQGKEQYDLLLNATSVGMYPRMENSPVSGNVVQCCRAVFDAVYNPEETALLSLAKQAGIPFVGGMEMLVYQAVAAHELWYGAEFRPEDLETLCEDAKTERERLFGGNGQ